MKVKLEDILEALDFINDDTQYYYDTKSEKVLMVFDGWLMVKTIRNLLKK